MLMIFDYAIVLHLLLASLVIANGEATASVSATESLYRFSHVPSFALPHRIGLVRHTDRTRLWLPSKPCNGATSKVSMCENDGVMRTIISPKKGRQASHMHGKDPSPSLEIVPPPVFHSSSVTYSSIASMREAASSMQSESFARYGSPQAWALEDAFAKIEGGYGACVVASGVSAINVALLAFLRIGDHALISDGVYDPTRSFCDRVLSPFGIEISYFDPCISAEELEKMIRPNTKVLFLESPSSLSFELSDFPSLCTLAKSFNLTIIADNTWGPSLTQPLKLGAHVCINAATKYIGGHSDVMLGLLACADEQSYGVIRDAARSMGCIASPTECSLALAGIKTLRMRLKHHHGAGLKVARWLEKRPEVVKIMHPALESHPQHELYKRDFTASCGLFGVQLSDRYGSVAVDCFLDSLKLFAMGYSWGGFESLVIPTNITSVRSVIKWKYGGGYGATIRLHIGLEDVDDLIQDMEKAFQSMEKKQKENGKRWLED